MAKEQQMVYGVLICRSDGQHIEAIESTDYKKCYECWQSLNKEWASAAKDQRPFVLEDPVVTAFSPSMIYEIKLIPIMSQEMAQSATNNPYAKRMTEQGFGKTFPGANVDLLSR